MVGLFCFDGPLYKDKNGVYCNVTLTNEMFSRYFSVVNKLFIVVRTYCTDKTYAEMNMKALTLDNVEIVEVGNFNSIYGMFVEKRKTQKKLENVVENSDLIFARMPSQTSNVVLKIAQKMNKPYLVEVGGCAWDSFWNHGLLGKIIAPYMYFCARKNIKKALFATYVTKKFLQKRYPNNGTTTNCSNVYLPIANDSVLEERIKKINLMDSTHPVFGQAVNSIDVKYKGEHLILRAMQKLRAKGIYAEYQIVGPGTGTFLKQESARLGLSNQLVLVGTLRKDEIEKWYKSIDVYVQPSKQEGLPRSVIEAMNAACPAIGSNIAGIPELLDADCLFEPENIGQIQDVILKLLNSKDNMKKQSKINFEKAKEYELNKIENRRQCVFREYQNSVANVK